MILSSFRSSEIPWNIKKHQSSSFLPCHIYRPTLCNSFCYSHPVSWIFEHEEDSTMWWLIAKVDSDRKHPASIPGLNYKPDSLPGGAQVNGNQDLNLAHALLLSGERNGNPLQCSCLENPTDRGAWWATVHGVAQRWTCLRNNLSTAQGKPGSSS